MYTNIEREHYCSTKTGGKMINTLCNIIDDGIPQNLIGNYEGQSIEIGGKKLINWYKSTCKDCALYTDLPQSVIQYM